MALDDSCAYLRGDFYNEYVDLTQRSDFWSSTAHLSLTSCGDEKSYPAMHRTRHVCDFLTVVTAISDAYSCGHYIAMPGLNDVHWDEIASGRDFVIGRSTLRVSASSVLDQERTNVVCSKVIVKRLRTYRGRTSMQPADLSLFARELSILHHLHGHRNIVQLRGVGWLYDCLDDPCLTPCPKPALLLEEAAGTLDWLLAHAAELSFLTEMKICQDVANGLRALHMCHLVHGDVKPANVLVFPEPILVEGVSVPYYKCKISDFSIARHVGSQPCWFAWGTPLYMAPERGLIPAADLHLTDVWSLGVLFVQVTQRNLDLTTLTGNASQLERLVHQAVDISIQSSTWDTPSSNARRAIFDYTLRIDPHMRSLDKVWAALRGLFDLYGPLLCDEVSRSISTPYMSPTEKGLLISYENFKHTSGQVHDAILAALRIVVNDSDDPRQAQALYELAVITLSDYAGPIYSVEEGLNWLRNAAVLGDIRAQGLFYRVRKIHSTVNTASLEILDWLQHAASLGHKIAMEDLSNLDILRAEKATQLLANRTCRGYKCKNSSSSRISVNSGSDELLAKSDPASTIIVSSVNQDIDGLDRSRLKTPTPLASCDLCGDTPLILSSRCGNYSEVLGLLKSGSDPTCTNDIAENFMHFAGNFSPIEIRQFISRIPFTKRPHIFLQDAKGVTMDRLLDVFPLPPGTPLERAVAMNKANVVSTILQITKDMMPANGKVIRRAFLLALRLQLFDIQRVLLDFISTPDANCNKTLAKFHTTLWEHKGSRRTYLDAIMVGGVSGFGLGADVPLKWWRICQSGGCYGTALHDSISLFMSICPQGRDQEMLLDSAFPLVLQERFTDAIGALLTWKAIVTQGREQRVRSLKSLIWKGNEVSGRPSQTINFVDQIFYDTRLGTLLHQTMWSGDRATFNVLIHDFGANLNLPVPGRRIGTWKTFQLNTYALLAYTKHCDLWFVYRIRELGLTFDTPYSVCPQPPCFFIPPLFHALRRRRWPYAQWLMRHGAKLEQQLGSDWGDYDVLSRCMTSEVLHIELLEFLFPPGAKGGGSTYVPARLQRDDGFQVFYLIGKCHHRRPSYPSMDFVRIPTSAREASPLINYEDNYSDYEDNQSENESESESEDEELGSRNPGGDQRPEFPSPSEADNAISNERSTKVEAGTNKVHLRVDSSSNTTIERDICEPSFTNKNTLIHPDASLFRPSGRKRQKKSSKTRFRYIPSFRYGERSSEIWRLAIRTGKEVDYVTTTVPRVAQCWQYLLDVYPQVANACPQETTSQVSILIPLPVASFSHFQLRWPLVEWRWRKLTLRIPRWNKSPTLLELSLSMGIHSYALFYITFQHFHTRVRLRPETDPFPRQTWSDLLYRSPLDRLTVSSWRTCVLSTEYRYLPSIRDILFWIPLVIVITVSSGIWFHHSVPTWFSSASACVLDMQGLPELHIVLVMLVPLISFPLILIIAFFIAVLLYINLKRVERKFSGNGEDQESPIACTLTAMYVMSCFALTIGLVTTRSMD